MMMLDFMRGIRGMPAVNIRPERRFSESCPRPRTTAEEAQGSWSMLCACSTIADEITRAANTHQKVLPIVHHPCDKDAARYRNGTGV
jgi:hypothetical protein